MKIILALVLTIAVCLTTAFSPSRIESFYEDFLINLKYSKTDCIVAARSFDNPNYGYDWVRDSGLTMNTLMYLGTMKNTKTRFEWYERYLRWVLLVQNQPGTNGFDIRGEVKFERDGRLYTGPWGRNQDDGPALRAIVLINYANELLEENPMYSNYIMQKMWKKDMGCCGIKYDLEYVSHKYRDQSFELWEEVNGNHFYVLATQRKALILGSELAHKLNDTAAGDFYSSQVDQVNQLMDSYYDKERNLIIPTKNYGDSYIAKEKHDMDVATYLAALYGHVDGQSFGLFDERVLTSAVKLQHYFKKEYEMNVAHAELNLMGRYPNDIYDGNGMSRGNPWVLTTAAFADVLFRIAKHIKNHTNGYPITSVGKYAYQDIVGYAKYEQDALRSLVNELQDYSSVQHTDINQLIKKSSLDIPVKYVNAFADAFIAKGDALLSNIDSLVGPTHVLFEQLSRVDGQGRGAEHLTWSYAATLSAIKSRALLN